jgi:four helix bundle protein
MTMESAQNIKDRTFASALDVVSFSSTMSHSQCSMRLSDQLLRSGTSVGANVEEATAASSKNDFVYKLSIALREAREANYWLRLVKSSKLTDSTELDKLLSESEELKKILGAIVSSARGKRKSGS